MAGDPESGVGTGVQREITDDGAAPAPVLEAVQGGIYASVKSRGEPLWLHNRQAVLRHWAGNH